MLFFAGMLPTVFEVAGNEVQGYIMIEQHTYFLN